jgi:hypothetical protein
MVLAVLLLKTAAKYKDSFIVNYIFFKKKERQLEVEKDSIIVQLTTYSCSWPGDTCKSTTTNNQRIKDAWQSGLT